MNGNFVEVCPWMKPPFLAVFPGVRAGYAGYPVRWPNSNTAGHLSPLVYTPTFFYSPPVDPAHRIAHSIQRCTYIHRDYTPWPPQTAPFGIDSPQMSTDHAGHWTHMQRTEVCHYLVTRAIELIETSVGGLGVVERRHRALVTQNCRTLIKSIKLELHRSNSNWSQMGCMPI